MSRQRFRLASLVIVLLLLFGGNVLAAAPWAHTYGFRYPGSILTRIDTSYDAQLADYYYDLAGYDSREYSNNTTMQGASFAYLALDSDAIFFFSGHSRGGLMQFWDGTKYTWLNASGYSSSSPQSDQYLLKNKSTIGDVLLMVFGGCETALTSSDTGNLQDTATQKGVASTIGWSTTVEAAKHTTWLDQFNKSLKGGSTVAGAATSADTLIVSLYGQYDGGTKSWVVKGAGETYNGVFRSASNVRITPAHYKQ